MNNAPIGVYDSGFGGLSVWRELRCLLPHESLLYLGDGKNCPYGGRSRAEIEGFAIEAVERLVEEGVKMVVVGCNTATTAAVETLRKRWPDMPIVGLEPAVKPACLSTVTRKIAVLATAHSLSSDMFLDTAARYASDVEVVKVVGEGFVELVENDMEQSVEAERLVRKAVEPLLDKGVDKLVLGCTHYPLLLDKINMYVPAGVRVLPQGNYVAESLMDYLRRHEDMQKRLSTGGTLSLLTTEHPQQFNDNASIFLNHPVDAITVSL